MIKLVVTDIDGTLLEEGCTRLNPEYFDLIEKLTDSGVVFAVASGRHSTSIKKVFEPVQDKIWILSQNGGVLEHRDQSILLNPIPRQWVQEFWASISSHDKCDAILYTPAKTFCPFEGTPMHDLVKNGYKYNIEATGGWKNIPDAEYSMMTLYCPENVDEFFKEHLHDQWTDRMNAFVSGAYWVDFLMKGTHKGAGISYLQERYDIKKDEIIAFGDNLNDIKMLQAAGTSYAVSNARSKVKEIADIVIPGYEENGVLNTLKDLFEL